jgi:hypothetical protein
MVKALVDGEGWIRERPALANRERGPLREFAFGFAVVNRITHTRTAPPFPVAPSGPVYSRASSLSA